MATDEYTEGGITSLLRHKTDSGGRNKKADRKRKVFDIDTSLRGLFEKRIHSPAQAKVRKTSLSSKAVDNSLGTAELEVKEELSESLQHHQKGKTKKKRKSISSSEFVQEEKLSRTVFVGNLPSSADRKSLRRLFATDSIGEVESVRLRGAVPADPKTLKKVAVIRREFHPARQSITAYVVFQTVEQAQQAVRTHNGAQLAGRTLRVDMATPSRRQLPNEGDSEELLKSRTHQHDILCSVFLGNLSFNLTEDQVRRHFEPRCGKIVNVRLVRDANTGLGKGFGYVQFAERDSVQLALGLHLSELGGSDNEDGRNRSRPVRVQRCKAADSGDQSQQKKTAKKNMKESELYRQRESAKPKKRLYLASNIAPGNAREAAVRRLQKKKRQVQRQAERRALRDHFSPRALASQTGRKHKSKPKNKHSNAQLSKIKTNKKSSKIF